MTTRIELFTTNLLVMNPVDPPDQVLYDDFLAVAQELYPRAAISVIEDKGAVIVTGLHPHVTPADARGLQGVLDRMSLQPGWRPRPIDE